MPYGSNDPSKPVSGHHTQVVKSNQGLAEMKSSLIENMSMINNPSSNFPTEDLSTREKVLAKLAKFKNTRKLQIVSFDTVGCEDQLSRLRSLCQSIEHTHVGFPALLTSNSL